MTFDATDAAALDGFFADLADPIDHVLVTGPDPYYALLADLDHDRAQATLPIRRLVEPGDVAALAVHLMANTALTDATYDIDDGQQVVPSAEAPAAAP